MSSVRIAPIKQMITADVLDRLDVRVGTIVEVRDVEDSDKLVRLSVDFGDHKRNVLVGMKKERQNPKEIEGRQSLFIVNIEPRRMMGQLSEAMLLDIGYQDGIVPVLAVPERPVPNGVRAC